MVAKGFSNSFTTSAAGASVLGSSAFGVSATDAASPSPVVPLSGVEMSKIAIASPILATSSLCFKIFTIFPETGVGTSESTLSVAISTTESSSFTVSPSLYNQLIIVASITPSPMLGRINLYSAILLFEFSQR